MKIDWRITFITAIFALAEVMTSPDALSAEIFRDCADCPEMVTVPAGSFLRGSSKEDGDREGVLPRNQAEELPQHVVTIANSFSVARLETTRAEYAAFVLATGRADTENCTVWNESSGEWEKLDGKSWRDPGFEQSDTEPVVCVTWDDAVAYADWLATKTGKPYRLLSEAEWEYAARAGTKTARPWGEVREETCEFASVSDLTRASAFEVVAHDPAKTFNCQDGYVYTAPVGQFKPNAFGLYDMLGNVWEWMLDCGRANNENNYELAPTDGSPNVTGDCGLHTYRGGSWYDPPRNTRIGRRPSTNADHTASLRGFRLARDLD